MKYNNKKVLITNHFLKDFSGSELAVYDLSKEFINLGFEVFIGSFKFDYPLKDLFGELDYNFLDLNKIDDSYDNRFDIIWAQHFTTLDKIFLETKISSNFVVYSSLSPYESLESPPLSSEKVNLFLANSFETKNKLLDMGLSDESIYILPNPVRDNFFKVNNKVGELKRIAVVSNHIPNEIRETISCLRNDGFDVVLYGLEGIFELITPSILEKYDAVITIGRTVQYCLAMEIPVYCYDRFGGCGWIISSNIEEASTFNFSGRCTGRKLTVNEILKEIKEQYGIAKYNIISNKDFAENNYKLSNHLSYILDNLKSEYIKFDINFFKNISLRQRKYINHLTINSYFIQLFVGNDKSYSEERSIKFPILQTIEIQKFEFDLKDFQNIRNLRLDPLNDSCVVNVSQIYLVLDDDLQIDLKSNIQANICSHHGDNYFFESFDPQIYFENTDFESLSIKKFVIELSYNHIAKDAVHICANQITVDKNQELETKEQIIQNQNQELETKEQIIQSQNQELETKEQIIQNQNQELETKEQIIQSQNQELETKEQIIQSQNQELETKEQIIQSQNQELETKEQIIQSQNQELETKEQIIQSQNQELETKEQIIQSQNQELETKEQIIRNLNDELISIYMSKSWKITRPLRNLMRKLKKR